MKAITSVLITLAVAVPLTWYVGRQFPPPPASASTQVTPGATPGGRKVLYYQSAMHPWIKSDKPGRCTICGMQLTPVYEGETGPSQDSGVVPLTQSMIQVLHVRIDEAQIRPLHRTLSVDGVLEENTTRHQVISAYIPGRIDKLYVSFLGAEVQRGQPLAEFYSPSLLQAEREYRALQGDLQVATALRLRQMGLLPEQIEALPAKPETQLFSQILAPMGGTVVAQKVYAGQYVQEGESLFEMADLSTLWFQFEAYEQDLPWIRPGLTVDITTPSHPGHTFAGTITFVEPNLNSITRSTKVRVELENPRVDERPLLLLGSYADGRVHLEAPEVLTVPRSAVIQTGPQAVVYVDLGQGAYARRTLTLGRRGDELVEVIQGLEAGEKVVINGNLLIDGQAEMNRTFAPSEPPASVAGPTNTPSVTLPALNDAQREAARTYLQHVDALGDALAADDLAAFNRLAPSTSAMLQALATHWRSVESGSSLIGPIEGALPSETASDLKGARRLFHPLSSATVALAQALRRTDASFDALKIYRCPMTKDAFPGAPPRAEWLQLRPGVRNPYFGAEMLDCGAEVKP